MVIKISVGFLLTALFLMAVFSMKDDSLTTDELAHLPAGYSYLTQKDMRLNPEHPPLVKDLAALPLLFIKNIKFPSEIKAWQDDVNGQWEFGNYFLFKTGNPAEKMIFWGRLPMILILLLLGFYIFKWTKELFGNKAGLLALFLFSFSPTFLAHGRLVTTDVGAAAGAFISLYYFIKVLQNFNKRNIILAGLALGIAQLLKFSLVLLNPLLVFLAITFFVLKIPASPAGGRNSKEILKILIFVFIIGYILVGLVYQYHVWNYPQSKQVEDIKIYLADYPAFIKNPVIASTQVPVLRAYSQYLAGVFMVIHRASFGHTIYFMGEVSNLGWKKYFPTVYLLKEPLSLHILSLIALLYAVWLIKWSGVKNWLKSHFTELAMLSFLFIYWASSLKSPLNLGVRHLLPTLPFVMALSSGMIMKWLKIPRPKGARLAPQSGAAKFKMAKYSLITILILWQSISVIRIYPYFLAYFNEIAGGPDKGYVYTVDSNLDWGQDLKRLNQWLEKNKIKKIKIAYFGGSDIQYYLGEKAESFPWNEPQKGWLAVSASLLQLGRGEPIPQIADQQLHFFDWLNSYKPITKIGYSIFIYNIQ